MIRVFTFLIMVTLLVTSQTIQAQQTISVTVENVPSNKGRVGFALFNTQENFLRIPLHGDQLLKKVKAVSFLRIYRQVPTLLPVIMIITTIN